MTSKADIEAQAPSAEAAALNGASQEAAPQEGFAILKHFHVAWHPERDGSMPIDWAKDDHAMIVRFPGGAVRCMVTAGEKEMEAWTQAHTAITDEIGKAKELLAGDDE